MTYKEPPEGWFTFGTHVEIPGPLEFSDETDEAGMPLWERLVVNPVMVVRSMKNGTTGERLGRYCFVWCPGCERHHCPVVAEEDGWRPSICWDWDGNLEAPTFSPSYLEYGWENDARERCHSFIKAGKWQFLSDCTHALAGQTVDMVPVPDWLMVQ